MDENRAINLRDRNPLGNSPGAVNMRSGNNGVFWIGQDGNVWVKGHQGVNSAGAQDNNSINYWSARGFRQIDDPNPVGGGGNTFATSSYDARQAARDAQEAAERDKLRSEIRGYGGTIDQLYNQLFSDLSALIKERDLELERDYAEQLERAGSQYAEAIPEIETSYAAIGAADSTDNTYAKNSAKSGFEDTTKTIGKNKKADKAKLGQYAREQRTAFEVDRDEARKQLGRVDQTEDLGALRGFRDSISGNISSAKKARATLGTDKGARGEVSRITADGGRFEEAIGALDSILKSSMSGAVKEAAVKAMTDSAGFSEDEKKKVQQQYGNVYAEQQAL